MKKVRALQNRGIGTDFAGASGSEKTIPVILCHRAEDEREKLAGGTCAVPCGLMEIREVKAITTNTLKNYLLKIAYM